MGNIADASKELFINVPRTLDGAQSTIVGIVDVSLGAELLQPYSHPDAVTKVIDLALMKPVGVALAVFGAFCLKEAAVHAFHAVGDRLP